MREAITGDLGTFILPKRSAVRPQRNLDRRAARRAVLPGYPVEPRPFTKDEIDAYLSGDRIVCLLCGQKRRSLGTHIGPIHNVTVDEYKTMFGLPWRTGLACSETRVMHSEIMKGSLAENDHLAPYRHLARTGKHRPKQPYAIEAGKRRMMDHMGLEREYDDRDFDAFLARMAQGRTRIEVLSDEDMPGSKWISDRLREDEARLRYEATIDALPFPVQARMEALGKRFLTELRRLRHNDGGCKPSDHVLAKMLGVTSMTVNRFRRAHGVA